MAALRAVSQILEANTAEECGPEIVDLVLVLFGGAAAVLLIHAEDSFIKAGFSPAAANAAIMLRFMKMLRDGRAAAAIARGGK